jgi:hypothetical protein
LCGTCGVSSQRTFLPPRSTTSSFFSARARLAMSVTQMLMPTWPCLGVRLGAAASHSLIAPDSSASTWLHVVQRSLSSGITLSPPRDQREHRAMAVVEQQRLVGVDQELVEGEAVRPDCGTRVERR